MGLFDNPNESWRQFGQKDPYYGVLSAEEFRAKNLTQASLKTFFDSGETHIEHMLRTAAERLKCKVGTAAAMDFGCGVGRLVVPLAKRFDRVAGVDISRDYIAEARRNCETRGLANVEFAETVAALKASGRGFDFIHSCIVFNHIPWRDGQNIIREMFQLLNPFGVMAIGVLHHREVSRLRLAAQKARRFLPLNWLFNLCRGRPVFEPLMQSNIYSLDELLPMLHNAGAEGSYVQTHRNENNESWAVIFCVRGGD